MGRAVGVKEWQSSLGRMFRRQMTGQGPNIWWKTNDHLGSKIMLLPVPPLCIYPTLEFVRIKEQHTHNPLKKDSNQQVCIKVHLVTQDDKNSILLLFQWQT